MSSTEVGPKPFADSHQARLIFLGTKDFALPAFEHLCRQGWNVVGLITQPDKPQGRKQLIIPSKIRLAAEALGIPVFQPESLNAPEGQALLETLHPDLLVTVAYGQILKPHILSVAPFGGVNLHGSLLPKYRGAAPVARAMQSGDAETGVTVIQMSPLVDAGGILNLKSTTITNDETAAGLEARLGQLGAPLLESSIKDYLEGRLAPTLQDSSLATRAPKLTKEEARISWNEPAFLVDRFIRAMNPWPLARTFFVGTDGRSAIPVTIHESRLIEPTEPTGAKAQPGEVVQLSKEHIEVACGDQKRVLLKVLQAEGRKALPAADWARGTRVTPGDKFVSELNTEKL